MNKEQRLRAALEALYTWVDNNVPYGGPLPMSLIKQVEEVLS